ncbi:MAG: hypothetical protein KDB87_17355, partial [Flavobacteriales bacterium]|nr:hypothetical protein [Flavobacteriales bacterium]
MSTILLGRSEVGPWMVPWETPSRKTSASRLTPVASFSPTLATIPESTSSPARESGIAETGSELT